MRKMRVLVADDEPELLDMMTRRLARTDLEVDLAEDGTAALDLVKQKDYDLIISDIYMPGGTGIEVVRNAKKHDPYVQAIITSASATTDNAIEALNQGAFAYLEKPFQHIGVFDATVSRALEFRRLLLDKSQNSEDQGPQLEMVNEEATERIQQLQKDKQELTELVASLPDGVVVVEEGGNVVLSSTAGEKWLQSQLPSGEQPILRYVERVHEDSPEENVEYEIGSQVVRLITINLPQNGVQRRKVVIIREVESEASNNDEKLFETVTNLRQGLARLYREKLGKENLELVKSLALQVYELELLVGLTQEQSGNLQPDPPTRQEDAPQVHIPEPAEPVPTRNAGSSETVETEEPPQPKPVKRRMLLKAQTMSLKGKPTKQKPSVKERPAESESMPIADGITEGEDRLQSRAMELEADPEVAWQEKSISDQENDLSVYQQIGKHDTQEYEQFLQRLGGLDANPDFSPSEGVEGGLTQGDRRPDQNGGREEYERFLEGLSEMNVSTDFTQRPNIAAGNLAGDLFDDFSSDPTASERDTSGKTFDPAGSSWPPPLPSDLEPDE